VPSRGLGRWAESSEFAAIVRRCVRRVGLPRDCEDDVAQEVRLRFLQQRVRAARGVAEPPLVIVAAVARRVALEIAGDRRRARRLEPEQPAGRPATSSGLAADLHQLAEDLARFGDLLTPAQARAVELSAQGVGPRRAAAALGISVAAFQERLMRAIRRLRGEAGRPGQRAPAPSDLPGSVAKQHPLWAKALRLHEWGLSHRRIGQALGLTREAARSLLKRLRRTRET
jgi:DNA-directed RNA polymerase specialized sigma24 family protein